MNDDIMKDEEFLAEPKMMVGEDAHRQRKYLETQERWRREQEKRNNQAKNALFQALNERLDIAWVEVDYDGSCDEGNVEEIRYLDIDREELELEEPNLDDIVEEYVYSLLPGGWEIEEGGYGTVEIDVIEGKAHVTHSRRVIEEYEYTEEFEE
jgi:hypothetical protein